MSNWILAHKYGRRYPEDGGPGGSRWTEDPGGFQIEGVHGHNKNRSSYNKRNEEKKTDKRETLSNPSLRKNPIRAESQKLPVNWRSGSATGNPLTDDVAK